MSMQTTSDIQVDERTGRPRKIRGDFPLPQIPGDVEQVPEVVKNFLKENASDLGLDATAENLELIQDVNTPTRRILRFQEKIDDVPIFEGVVIVQVDNESRVQQVDIQQTGSMQAVTPSADTSLSTDDAFQSVLANLGNPEQRLQPESPKQVYFPTRDGLKLAYFMVIPTQNPLHDWQIVVDAYTGQILSQEDLIKYMPDGQGLVFDPNPVVTSGNNTLRDPDATVAACGFSGTARDTINAQRVTRTLRDIALSGGKYKLEGPFCKIRNFGAPNVAHPEEASANAFNYSSGDADRRFEAVNVYYHVDTLQRYVQSLGITNANNRQVECDPYDNTINAAWYSPADKGLHFSDSGPCRPDRGEDGEVMFHEYGHAMQDNQVPGWGGKNPTTNRYETGAMGEGFGDTLACVYFAPDHPFQREFFEDWIFGDTAIGCLRRVDGTKVYPTNWTGSVHSDGEIWSAALWNIYRAIGGDSMNVTERRAARDALLKALILSHFSVAANGTMPDGAEALMKTHAELSDYRGKYLMQMLDSFHTRGLLPCSPQADLYIREDASDPGVDLFTGPVFWNSPDLWIRNANDNGTDHQNPEAGQDNWFYARVRNRGTATARAFVVTFNVKPWAGIQFTYPDDFVPFISAAVGFNLPAGGSTIVKAKWPASLVPPAGTHACWLVSVYTPVDTTATGRHVWESNNLAQKNLTIVNLQPDTSTVIKFQLGSLQAINPERFRLELRRPQAWSTMPVSIVHENPEIVRALARSIEEVPITVQPVVQPSRFVRFLEPARVELGARGVALSPVSMMLGRDSMLDLDAATTVQQLDALAAKYEADLIADAETAALAFRPGLAVGFPIGLRPRTQIEFGLRVTAPSNARPGDEILIDLYQRNERNEVVGGISVQVNVVQ
jgi:hypothetical protein